MIRCVRLWTGQDDASHFQAGWLDMRPGDVLLAEDPVASGHQWRLDGPDPWRRMYLVLVPGTEVPFVAD
jgi:hypothetical protein